MLDLFELSSAAESLSLQIGSEQFLLREAIFSVAFMWTKDASKLAQKVFYSIFLQNYWPSEKEGTSDI